MSRTVLLVFAIISLVVGSIFMTVWSLILAITLGFQERFPGSFLTQEGYFLLYSAFSIGIISIVVSIVLFVLRAKKAD